jgi:hypothetical protein
MQPVRNAKSRAHAWLESADLLLAAHDRIYNLVVEIDQPAAETPQTRAVEALVDKFLEDHRCQPIETVAETIFPATEYKSGGLQKVYQYPTSIYPHIKSINGNRWGTYALRLVERKCSDGTTIRPLELAIDKLKGQLKNRSTQRAVYELDMALEPLELKFYDAETDHDNARGGQCLSHVSLKLGPNKELYLTAVYRYQFFIQKALGNFKGLARLQSCIAREVGIPVGPLVCHATLAVLEEGTGEGGQLRWGRTDLEHLVRDCKAALQNESQPTPEGATA